jgi:hypothetical protein
MHAIYHIHSSDWKKQMFIKLGEKSYDVKYKCLIETFPFKFPNLSVLNVHEYQIILPMKECELVKYI